MDYLPNIDHVSVTKIGPFGLLYNSLWKVSDIEKIDVYTSVMPGELIRDIFVESE